MRLFIAITLPNKLKNRIARVQQRIQSQVSAGRFTDRDNLHLTLHFIGQVDEGRVADLTAMMDAVAKVWDPFYLEPSHLDSFDKKNRKIIYLSVDGDLAPLQELYSKLARDLKSLGFAVEDRPYTAHITLGRQVKVDNELEIESPKLPFVVSGITLMHSTRVDDRLTYVPIHRSPFQNGEHIIERIEGSVALLENLGGDHLKTQVDALPSGAREGAVLVKRGDTYTLDEARTIARQKSIDDRLKSLKK